MHTSHLKQIIFVFITAIGLALTACNEEPSSENGIQQSLDSLLVELKIATMGSNVEGLEAVISTAGKIRPTAQAQIQSKNLLLSTAKEKLAHLQFQILSAKTTATLPMFTLAENQAIQVALLRGAAKALSQAAQEEPLLSETIATAQDSKRDHFNDQLNLAISELNSQESTSQESRDRAEILREEADGLLNDAEDAGLVEGHSTYKSGVKKMRKSQRADLTAAEIELQSQMHTKPLRDEARAELEAIASILNGMEHTEDLLKQLQSTTVQNASDFRELADELDTKTAETMNAAIAQSSTIKQEWNALSALIQDAMRSSGQSRGASREAKQTAGIWKLDLEWSLGQVEESKRAFLIEEGRTIQALIEHEIVASSGKWRELAESNRTEVEQATISAISAFENAKQLASNAGQQGVALIGQLDRRMAILNGDAIPVPAPITETVGSSSPTTSGERGSFDTPQALVAAFNDATDISALDGTAPPVDLNQFYKFEDDQAAQFIALMNRAFQSTGNNLIAVRNHIGVDAVDKIRAESQTQGKSFLMAIEPSSIMEINEGTATATDLSGKPVRLQQTPNGWKIVLSSTADPEAAMAFSMMSEMLPLIFDSIDSITAQINDGQITTVEQIEEATMSQIENMNPF
jgi:hypothetical protein